ncbi:MAG: tetratricopeptide repeat protein [Thiogranum sp.]|nr:tetratricopeptide repeat protein [Thiogranum sp.]
MRKLLLCATVATMGAALISACSNAPLRTGTPPVTEGSAPPVYQEQSEAERSEPQTSGASASGAVVALLDRADAYRSAGDTGSAAATIERALRIDPRNPRLWSQLAALRLEQEQPQQTVQLAMKSNALATTDQRLQAHNWRMIAAARHLLQDSAGARDAERRAAALQ